MDLLKKFLPSVTAQAHCDVPCGIYDPTAAKVAAKTVARMVDQLEALELPKDSGDHHAVLSFQHMVARRVAVKEQHAESCKRELEILWSDFFKAEHLAKFPQLHDTFWKAVKLCSKNKQDVSKDAAAGLVAAVDEIAKMFYKAKGAPERFAAYQRITDALS
jgi:nickel superoxide dismutase